jgi:hypothetical protein
MAKKELLPKEHEVESLTLVKVETDYRNKLVKYFYNLRVSDIAEELIIESEDKIEDVVGKKFSYKLDKNSNDIIDFEFE